MPIADLQLAKMSKDEKCFLKEFKHTADETGDDQEVEMDLESDGNNDGDSGIDEKKNTSSDEYYSDDDSVTENKENMLLDNQEKLVWCVKRIWHDYKPALLSGYVRVACVLSSHPVVKMHATKNI